MSTSVANQAEFQSGGKPVAPPIYLVDNLGVPISSTNPLNVDVAVSVDPAANQRVNTQAGDIAAGSAVSGAFVAGAITDLSTLPAALTELLTDADNLANINHLQVAQSGYVALTSPPATTNAGSDTALTFSSQINNVIVENNTSANVYVAFDTAATLGSIALVPGMYYEKPKKVTVLHLYTVAAQNINGSAVGAIVVLGEL